jgi:hypothetical protein
MSKTSMGGGDDFNKLRVTGKAKEKNIYGRYGAPVNMLKEENEEDEQYSISNSGINGNGS